MQPLARRLHSGTREKLTALYYMASWPAAKEV
jgi:hypothetical protein